MKKNVIIVIVVLLAVGLAVYAGMKMNGPSSEAVATRKAAEGQTVQLIDVASLEPVNLTAGERAGLKADPATGYCKDGDRTLADIIKCASCGADIPAVPIHQGKRPFMDYRRQEYKCPKCGKAACAEGLSGQKLPKPEGYDYTDF